MTAVAPVFTVEVGVALSRPPKTDEYRRVRVAAENGDAAELLACQIASCTSVMAIESVVVDWPVADPAGNNVATSGTEGES